MSFDVGDGRRAQPRTERHDSDTAWAAGIEQVDVGFAWTPGVNGRAGPCHPVVDHARPLAVAGSAAVLLAGIGVALTRRATTRRESERDHDRTPRD
jgi:hypothetical protein